MEENHHKQIKLFLKNILTSEIIGKHHSSYL